MSFFIGEDFFRADYLSEHELALGRKERTAYWNM